MLVSTVAEMNGEGRGEGTEADPLGVTCPCLNYQAIPNVRRLRVRGGRVTDEPVWPETPTTAEFETRGAAALSVLRSGAGETLWVREAWPGGALVRGRLAAWEGGWRFGAGLRLRLTLISPVIVTGDDD